MTDELIKRLQLAGRHPDFAICMEAAARIAALESNAKATGPEGCTPADAAMLRQANHSLAAENDHLRRALRPFANLVSNDRLSWAMVEYQIDGDPEKQTFQRPHMQHAFNRAVEALQENLPVDCHEIDHGTHIEMVPHYGEPPRPADAQFTRETPGASLTDDPTVVIATPINWHMIIEATRHATQRPLPAAIDNGGGRDAEWFALADGAAAELEQAAIAITDLDAKRIATSGAAHIRKRCKEMLSKREFK